MVTAAAVMNDAKRTHEENMLRWRLEAGIVKGTVRIDFGLSDPNLLVVQLKWFRREIDRILDRMINENTTDGKRHVAQTGLYAARLKLKPRPVKKD